MTSRPTILTTTLFIAAVATAACSNAKSPEPTIPSGSAPSGAGSGSASANPNAGTVETVKFHSDALGVDKNFVLYLPAGYASSTKHYPVFYYLHGLGGDETNWTAYMHLDDAANKLGLQAIVVMPDGDDSFYVDSPAQADYDACMKDGTGLLDPSEAHATTCVRKNNYETYVVKELVSYVDGHYRTITSRDGRAIAGLSMGGGHTVTATNNNPGVFGWIGVFSAGARTTDEAFEKQLAAVKAGGVNFYWTGAGSTDMARQGR